MSKTIREVLVNYTIANNNRVSKYYQKLKSGSISKADEESSQKELDEAFDQALAEISRLIDGAKPNRKTTAELNGGWRADVAQGFNEAIDQFSANLDKIKGMEK